MKRYAPKIYEDMLIWVPIMRNRCTLAELKTVLDYDDLCDIHEAINLEEAIKALPRENKADF